MGSNDDGVECSLGPSVPFLDEAGAWGGYGCPSTAPYFEVVQFRNGRGIWWATLFFWRLWCFGFPPPQLLPCGSMACAMAMCHLRIGGGVLDSGENFLVSHIFWGASFKSLVLSLCVHFCKIPVHCVCLLWAPFGFHYHDFYTHLLPLLVLLPFSSTPLYFSCFLFPFWASFFCVLFPFWNLAFFFCFLLMDFSGIMHTSPSVSFSFVCLGAFIGYRSGSYPPIKYFSLGDSSLSLVLGELYPLLCESLNWFKSVRGVLRREKMSSKVRSSDLVANLSSSAGTGEVETDVVVSRPSSSCPFVPASPWPFYALQEECSLNQDTFHRFRNQF